MASTYFQVVGRNPCMIDYPTGDSVAHRPGAVFEADPTNGSVQRAARAGRLREMSTREATALRNVAVVAVKPTPGLPKKIEPAKPADPVKLIKKPESK